MGSVCVLVFVCVLESVTSDSSDILALRAQI